MLAQLEERLAGLQGIVAAIARELIVRCRELMLRARELEREITLIVRRLAPSLLTMPGCSALSAAKIVGETAGVTRFRSKAAFARWNGTAPIPVWSGNSTHHRLTRGGNRQINATRIAVTQMRGVGGLGQAYVERRMAAGDSRGRGPACPAAARAAPQSASTSAPISASAICRTSSRSTSTSPSAISLRISSRAFIVSSATGCLPSSSC